MSTSLLPDAGTAAASADFFRSRAFLAAEGTTHTLVVEEDLGRVALPVVVRGVPGSDLCDAVSPYGYPGGRSHGSALPAGSVDLTSVGLVSLFVRDRLGQPALAGGTSRSLVVLHDPSRSRAVSKTFRRDLRRCTVAGYEAELLPGTEVDDDVLDGFAAAYLATMDHVGAADRYRFSPRYLRECLAADGSWLVVVHDPSGSIVAGELVVTSDGLLHSYLAGTRSEHRRWSPGKLATARAMDLADDLGLCLNFGGGLAAGDGVEQSKRSYGNASATFVTHELVGDPAAVATLTGAAPRRAGYFPPYRAPLLDEVRT